MPIEDTMFNRAQMHVPPELSEILKQFTKAAIRTQPEKLLDWSAAYFSALKEGQPLPVKTRYEMGNATGLTFGILKILNKQLGLPRQQPISVKDLKEKWQDIGLTEEGLDKICVVGNFNLSESSATINMEHFVAVAANSLVQAKNTGDSNKSPNNATSELGQALTIVCDLFTNDDEGGASRVKIEQFERVFTYLANVAKIPMNSQEAILSYMTERAGAQGGLVMPANFQSKDCPSF